MTWTSIAPGITSAWGVAVSANGQYVAIGEYSTPARVAISNDGGASFTVFSTPTSYIRGISISNDGQKIILAPWFGNSMYTSHNGGASWTQVTSPGAGSYWSLAASEDGMKAVVLLNNARPFTSTNGGLTWTSRDTANRAWRYVTSSSDGTKLAAVANGGTVYTSVDSGVTWVSRAGSGSRAWSMIGGNSTGSILIASLSTGTTAYRSTDSGATWNTLTMPVSTDYRGIAVSDDGTNIIVSAYNNYIYMSTDSGATWVPQTSIGTGTWTYGASSADLSKSVNSITSTGLTWVYTATPSGGASGQVKVKSSGVFSSASLQRKLEGSWTGVALKSKTGSGWVETD